MSGKIMLFLLMLLGILGKSNVIATSACILLILKLADLTKFLPFLQNQGINLGLLFLLIGVLVPFADGRVQLKNIKKTITSLTGLFAIAGGILATHLNGEGLHILKIQPQLMLGIVIGSLIGIVFLKGQPVGPLMAAGIMAFLLEIVHMITG